MLLAMTRNVMRQALSEPHRTLPRTSVGNRFGFDLTLPDTNCLGSGFGDQMNASYRFSFYLMQAKMSTALEYLYFKPGAHLGTAIHGKAGRSLTATIIWELYAAPSIAVIRRTRNFVLMGPDP